jgi:hypothetical protein
MGALKNMISTLKNNHLGNKCYNTKGHKVVSSSNESLGSIQAFSTFLFTISKGRPNQHSRTVAYRWKGSWLRAGLWHTPAAPKDLGLCHPHPNCPHYQWAVLEGQGWHSSWYDFPLKMFLLSMSKLKREREREEGGRVRGWGEKD